MKYLILFESFESNILSKMINFLNKKIDNTSKQKFERKIKTLISQFDIPIDKINDKDIKYLNKNQAIKLRNIDNNVCITIQCYMYDNDDIIHYDYFDYLDIDNNILHYEPDSDMEFIDFKNSMKQEWEQNNPKKLFCCI